MSWDFETEPEFQEKLDWADAFVRENVEPLDLIWPHLAFTPPSETIRKVIDPLKQAVREQGLWATHLGPELGGQGARRGQALPAERDPGPVELGPGDLRVPGPGH